MKFKIVFNLLWLFTLFCARFAVDCAKRWCNLSRLAYNQNRMTYRCVHNFRHSPSENALSFFYPFENFAIIFWFNKLWKFSTTFSSNETFSKGLRHGFFFNFLFKIISDSFIVSNNDSTIRWKRKVKVGFSFRRTTELIASQPQMSLPTKVTCKSYCVTSRAFFYK